jgi:hypothetical protein
VPRTVSAGLVSALRHPEELEDLLQRGGGGLEDLGFHLTELVIVTPLVAAVLWRGHRFGMQQGGTWSDFDRFASVASPADEKHPPGALVV